MILFGLSLLAGVLTVLAPCTLSLLPVIVGGSVGGGQSARRALVVAASLGLSVILFTFLLKASASLVAIPQEFWQLLSGTIILCIGLTMLFPALWERLSITGSLNRGSNRLIAAGYQKKNLAGDMLIGAALGPVFSSCSPTYFLILATVLPRSFAEGVVYLLAYTVGLCGSLLVVTVASQKLLPLFGVASDPDGWIKRAIGVLFVLLGIAIIVGYDKKLELIVANNVFDVTQIEQRFLSSGSALPAADGGAAVSQDAGTRARMKAAAYQQAPEIADPSGFVNTGGAPITFSQFKGKKVVLVDFWTYSCINCQRTLPYVKAWYDKYRDQGLEIISIHTPEFGFEKIQSNVEKAVADEGVQYPVVLDNNYGTWRAFQNNYWPRKYLIDIDGYIVYDHAGEGAYDETEQAIQKALAERAQVLGTTTPATGIVAPKDAITPDMQEVGSPETYFGSARNEYLSNGAPGVSGPQTLSVPVLSVLNALTLSGEWNFTPEYAETSQIGARILYTYKARDVYFVASAKDTALLEVLVDGKPVGEYSGADVSPAGELAVRANRLYKVLHGASYGQHTLELRLKKGRLQAYTFTFG